ncbi:Gp19/Gp15/Gp42 family protein [Pseudonocardia sp. T1-2H]|uniref:Gp19/Gp15/Gp42 family protein n=1 Tax=Pseudonocardia sp. T1-2H TaxID=3128899 RepID=UPI00310184DD
MTPLVTAEDVAKRLATEYVGVQLMQVDSLCEDVSALIRSRLPKVDEWIADGSLAVDAVVAVAVQVVARALTSVTTGGVGIRSEQHPEYSYELTASTAAGLNLSNRELVTLTPTDAVKRPFSIQPGGVAA